MVIETDDNRVRAKNNHLQKLLLDIDEIPSRAYQVNYWYEADTYNLFDEGIFSASFQERYLSLQLKP